MVLWLAYFNNFVDFFLLFLLLNENLFTILFNCIFNPFIQYLCIVLLIFFYRDFWVFDDSIKTLCFLFFRFFPPFFDTRYFLHCLKCFLNLNLYFPKVFLWSFLLLFFQRDNFVFFLNKRALRFLFHFKFRNF